MTLYNFLEELFAKGGDLKAVKLVSVEPKAGKVLFEQTERLFGEFNQKPAEEQINHKGNRRFGFDRGSRIGDLEVSLVKRARSLSGGRVEVGISICAEDQRRLAQLQARQQTGR